MGARDDRGAIVDMCPLFAGLARSERESLAAAGRLRRVPAGKALFVEGERSDSLWVLGSGAVKLHHTNEAGNEYVLGFPRPGAPLVVWALLDQRPFTATATTLTEVSALVIDRADFLDAVRHHPGIAARIINELCVQLRQRDIGAGVGALRDARGRLACRLLQVARQYGAAAEQGTAIAYPLTRRDLARATGVTFETAVRALSRLRREGVLDGSSQRLVIRDFHALRQVAGCPACLYDCSVFADQAVRDPSPSARRA